MTNVSLCHQLDDDNTVKNLQLEVGLQCKINL